MATASKRIKLDRRPLPPELLTEMHKFLPIEQQVDLIMEVPSRVILLNNGPRIRRTLEFIKECLRNFIAQHYGIQNWDELDERTQSHVGFYSSIGQGKSCKWKSEYGALIRFGAAFTPIRHFDFYKCAFHVVPANLIDELTFQLANSRYEAFSGPTNSMLKMVELSVKSRQLPEFLGRLFLNKKFYSEGTYTLFNTFLLKSPRNGQSLRIIDARMGAHRSKLTLFIANYCEDEWFQIEFQMDKYGGVLLFRYEQIPKLNETVQNEVEINDQLDLLEQPGNDGPILKSKYYLKWDHQWDMLLRRGAQFTRIRHFQIDKDKSLYACPRFYEEELIRYMAETSHPEQMLETIDLIIKNDIEWPYASGKPTLLPTIWCFCQEGMAAGKQTLIHQKMEFKILQGTAKEPRTEFVGYYEQKRQFYWLQFTLANGPTNGAYVFDVEAEFTEEVVERDKTIAIKIRRRQKMQNEEKTQVECSSTSCSRENGENGGK